MNRLRLYWRLVCCWPKVGYALRFGTDLELRRVWSEVESIRRDLGHDYDHNAILREHQ